MSIFSASHRKQVSADKPHLKARFSSGDPLTIALDRAAMEETSLERGARLAREEMERTRSLQIDRELEMEVKEKKKKTKDELELLLLGPSGAGKTTFVKQLRLAYDPAGLNIEREACRLVVLLTIVQSTRTLLSLLEVDTAATSTSSLASVHTPTSDASSSSDGDICRPLSSPSTSARSELEANHRRRVRLAPLLDLEARLRETLGVVAIGPSQASMAAYASNGTEGVQKLGWRDPVALGPSASSSYSPLSGAGSDVSGGGDGDDSPSVASFNDSSGPRPEGSSPIARRNKVRTRAASPTEGDQLDPIFVPNFAERLGADAFGKSKESRRMRPQTLGTRTPGSSTLPDGAFSDGPDDPIQLLAALKQDVQGLWDDAVARGLIAGEGPRAEVVGGFELSDSSRLSLSDLPGRIAKPEWLPTDTDILNVRVRTLGIETHRLQISPTQVYKICDVAGARGLKHSWAPYFDDAAAIIFIVACSDYTIADPRDLRQNRLNDALDLFEEITTNPILMHVTMIVFLNKTDVLRKRIKSGLYPLAKYMPGYHGSDKTADVLAYMQSRFEKRQAKRLRLHEEASGSIYVYATQANDTKSIRFVLAAVNDILMRSTLAASGLL